MGTEKTSSNPRNSQSETVLHNYINLHHCFLSLTAAFLFYFNTKPPNILSLRVSSQSKCSQSDLKKKTLELPDMNNDSNTTFGRKSIIHTLIILDIQPPSPRLLMHGSERDKGCSQMCCGQWTTTLCSSYSSYKTAASVDVCLSVWQDFCTGEEPHLKDAVDITLPPLHSTRPLFCGDKLRRMVMPCPY